MEHSAPLRGHVGHLTTPVPAARRIWRCCRRRAADPPHDTDKRARNSRASVRHAGGGALVLISTCISTSTTPPWSRFEEARVLLLRMLSRHHVHRAADRRCPGDLQGSTGGQSDSPLQVTIWTKRLRAADFTLGYEVRRSTRSQTRGLRSSPSRSAGRVPYRGTKRLVRLLRHHREYRQTVALG